MQKHVEIPFHGQVLRGTKHVPKSVDKNCPAVLLLHGFTGNRIEGHRLFFHLSNALEGAGLASVRFDFLGSGESDGDYASMTLPLLVEQALTALQWMQAEQSPAMTYLLGFSLGGLVASLVTEQSPSVSKSVLISPGRARRILLRDRALYADPTKDVIDLNGNRVGRQYYLSLEPYLDQPSRFHAHQRILIIHGTADAATPVEFGKEYLRVPGGTKQFVEVVGADHGYSSLPWQEQLLGHVVRFLGDEA